MNNVIFKKIMFKNFMSYGNSWTTYDFQKGMTLVTGLNGNGKTAAMIALYYCLFGKHFKKAKLSSLVNEINNKDMLVEVWFDVNDEEYRIKRGQKPNNFIIMKDNELIEQESSVTIYQEKLENEILQFNENIFRQLIFLGANVVGAKSFIELTKAEKEELFQIITDTSLFYFIKEEIKQKTNGYKTEQTETKYKIDVLIETLKSEKNNIRQLEEQNANVKHLTDERKEHIANRLIEIDEKSDKIKSVLGKLKQIKTTYDGAVADQKRIKAELEEFVNEAREVSTEISKINSTKTAFKECIGCTKLNNLTKVDLTKEEEYNIKINKLNADIDTHKKILNECEEHINADRMKLDKGRVAKEQYDNFQIEKERLTEELTSINEQKIIEIDYGSIEAKEKEIDILKNNYTETSTHLSNLKKLDTLLSNDNLKGVVINQTLPLLNKYINEYMQKFTDFDFNFFIDSTFKENIVLKSREREFHTLSNGQGFRITFSILFAFLKLVEERNGVSTNLLVLDEVLDSSLDKNGRNELLSILKEEFSYNKEVIIISHNDDIVNTTEYFDRTYKVAKEEKFSKITKIG